MYQLIALCIDIFHGIYCIAVGLHLVAMCFKKYVDSRLFYFMSILTVFVFMSHILGFGCPLTKLADYVLALGDLNYVPRRTGFIYWMVNEKLSLGLGATVITMFSWLVIVAILSFALSSVVKKFMSVS